jgi:hypothetical protein
MVSTGTNAGSTKLTSTGWNEGICGLAWSADLEPNWQCSKHKPSWAAGALAFCVISGQDSVMPAMTAILSIEYRLPAQA